MALLCRQGAGRVRHAVKLRLRCGLDVKPDWYSLGVDQGAHAEDHHR